MSKLVSLMDGNKSELRVLEHQFLFHFIVYNQNGVAICICEIIATYPFNARVELNEMKSASRFEWIIA